jgi:hypothetical protein
MRKLRLPTPIARAILRRIAFLAVGDQRRYGVPRPDHPIWREHATISQELLSHVGHGWIRVKPNVRSLDGGRVSFEDGTSIPCDAIVYATGYRTRFPFLDPTVFAVRDGDARLYRRIAAPDRPGLYFAGLIQPIGATIPLVEHQGRWLAAVLAGELRLPDRATMEREIDRNRARIRRRYVDSVRYTLEVDFREHAGQLARDRAAGVAGA